jgi:hypothetical protein
MKTYHVKVAVRILEIYKVRAEDETSARDRWSEGELIRTCDAALNAEILSVKEA